MTKKIIRQETLKPCKTCNVFPNLEPVWVTVSNGKIVGSVLMKKYVCPQCHKESKPDYDVPKTVKQWNDEV